MVLIGAVSVECVIAHEFVKSAHRPNEVGGTCRANIMAARALALPMGFGWFDG